MSARTGLSGGYRATGIPTAITRLATERASAVTLHLQLARAGSIPTKARLLIERHVHAVLGVLERLAVIA
jgi:hypothetical protein